MNQYLIPANSKKSELILGMFTWVDLILFGTGVLITVILIVVFQSQLDTIGPILAVLAPALISAFLVFPVPNYHNVLQLLVNIYTFFFVRPMTYKWRGWCYKNERK